MKMNQPKVSVIMSVYNGEKFLSIAIESILNQSYTDFEFIIIDDCSTDESLKIINTYAQQDNRIKIITRDQNIGIKGFIKNLNYGISIAKGKYIARMDQDDISSENRFLQQASFLDNHPEIAMVGAQINFINEKGEKIGEKIGALEHNEITEKITSQIQLFHPVIMFRNYLNIYYREKFIYCEDYDLYLNYITENKKLANINEKLLDYRILETSLSRKGDNFIKKLMVEKSLYFYKLRRETGKDLYEDFDNQEVLEMNNFSYQNEKEEILFALDTAIKHNNKKEIKFLLKKLMFYYPNENALWKYKIYSKAPLPVFKFIKKLFAY